MALSVEDKRKLIYASERLKELIAERGRLIEKRDALLGRKRRSEAEKRYSIYIAERLIHLEEERQQTLAARAALAEAA